VNLPLLPADTANDAYGPQNRAEKTSLGPESSFSLNLYVQSLQYDRRIHNNPPFLFCRFQSWTEKCPEASKD
jgi:hypothetical protein